MPLLISSTEKLESLHILYFKYFKKINHTPIPIILVLLVWGHKDMINTLL